MSIRVFFRKGGKKNFRQNVLSSNVLSCVKWRLADDTRHRLYDIRVVNRRVKKELCFAAEI